MIRDDNWVLSVGTFLTMLGVLILFVTPKANEAAIKMVALLTSIATVLVGAFTLVSFNFDKAGSMQFVAETSWIPVIKSTYFIGVDGISLPLYLLSMVITLL
ncbi:MAG: NADH-quinone oxidoreductase subunit M, partial [Actinomycetota bacterium]